MNINNESAYNLNILVKCNDKSVWKESRFLEREVKKYNLSEKTKKNAKNWKKSIWFKNQSLII